MKHNEKIKYRIFANEWGTAKYVKCDKKSNIVLVKSHTGAILKVRPEDVFKFIELSDEDLQKFAQENIQKLHDLTVRAMKSIFSEDYCKEVKVKDNSLFLYSESISIDPCAVEVQSIGKFEEKPGWSVTIYKYWPGTQYEPPDVEDIFIDSSVSHTKAIYLALNQLYKLVSDDFWQTIDDEEYARQEEQWSDFEL